MADDLTTNPAFTKAAAEAPEDTPETAPEKPVPGSTYEYLLNILEDMKDGSQYIANTYKDTLQKMGVPDSIIFGFKEDGFFSGKEIILMLASIAQTNGNTVEGTEQFDTTIIREAQNLLIRVGIQHDDVGDYLTGLAAFLRDHPMNPPEENPETKCDPEVDIHTCIDQKFTL